MRFEEEDAPEGLRASSPPEVAEQPSAKKQGSLPSSVTLCYVALAFVPRLAVCCIVFAFGQLCRAVAKVVCGSVGSPHAANKRILLITDYMPPQCHGIALRVSQYTKHLRERGHEVHIFTTCLERRSRTSFDHATLPFVRNPFNDGNQISYSVGVRLAFSLGAESWDVVHVFYPNMLGLFVLPACRWRGILSYCSHHVDIDYYIRKYVSIRERPVLTSAARWCVTSLYDVCYKYPASYWSDINSSMTQSFLTRHLPLAREHGSVDTIGSGVDEERFSPTQPSQDDTRVDLLWLWCDPRCVDEREALCRRVGARSQSVIWLMVQRLAPEKETELAIRALARRNASAAQKGEPRAYLVIAGDGPARSALELVAEADKATHETVIFLGAVNNAALPSLYRAADVFVTCSRSETFGLTLTEALACGLPVAYVGCEVFDELYADKLPRAWRYEVGDASDSSKSKSSTSSHHEKNMAQRNEEAVIEAVSSALVDGKAWVARHPIPTSWKAAATDLERQYDSALERATKRNAYATRRQIAEQRLIHILRAALVAAAAFYVLIYSYQTVVCGDRANATDDDHSRDCRLSFLWIPRRVRAAALITLVIALEWAHC